jgi:hypothetical protein
MHTWPLGQSSWSSHCPALVGTHALTQSAHCGQLELAHMAQYSPTAQGS